MGKTYKNSSDNDWNKENHHSNKQKKRALAKEYTRYVYDRLEEDDLEDLYDNDEESFEKFSKPYAKH